MKDKTRDQNKRGKNVTSPIGGVAVIPTLNNRSHINCNFPNIKLY